MTEAKTTKKTTTKKKTTKKKTTNEYVIIRTTTAGVHVGDLVSRDGDRVVLTRASRVWRWRGANTLHEMSLYGAAEEYTRISEKVARIELLGALEIITCTALAQASLSRPRWG